MGFFFIYYRKKTRTEAAGKFPETGASQAAIFIS
jgi:hypothetical protein